MNCKNIILSTLIFFIAHFTLLAQFDQFKFTRIDVNKGLSHNQVQSIMKDSKGFMWFGTMSGLNRYDGYNFKLFRHDPGDSTSIRVNLVTKLFEDHEGKIWAGTRDGFSIYDSQTETFNNNPTSLLKKYSISVSSIVNIIKDRRGNYWYISSNKGLFKYSSSDKSFTHVTHNPKDSSTIYSNEVSDLAEDSLGYMWLIHKNGVLEKIGLENQKVIYRNYSLSKEAKGEKLTWNLTIDSDNDIWVCIPHSPRGVFYFNNRTKVLMHIDKSSEKINANNPTDVTQQNSLASAMGLTYSAPIYIDPVEVWQNHPIANGAQTVQIYGGWRVNGPGEVFVRPNGEPNNSFGTARTVGMGAGIMFSDEWISFDSEWQQIPEVPVFWSNMIEWVGPKNFCVLPQ